jgi:hypothetical protein
VFLAIRDEQPLFYMNTGDLHYLNIAQNDVQVFYNGYRQVLGSHTQRALYESTSFIYMWDDHDYGPNNSDASSPSRTASRLAYRDYIPHYPLPAGPGDAPIQQSFAVGRVKFIMTDLRSEKDVPSMPAGPNKRTMSLDQQQWFFNELLDGRDNYAATIWISSYPWIGSGSNGSDFWNGYTHHRDTVAAFIKNNQIHNLSMIAGDAHMLAIDDGTNNTYPDGRRGFPVFQAAALTSSGSVKGGPYTSGTYPGNGQYGMVHVTDSGGPTVAVYWEGKHKDGRVLISHAFTVDASHLLPDFTITGRVTDQHGLPVAGVAVAAGSRATTTDSDGHYTLPVPAGSQHLVPSKAGYTFTPASRSVEIDTTSMADVHFVATANPQYVVSYAAGPGGSIAGAVEQLVPEGGNASPVVGQPAPGFQFLRWSDGLATASRSDTAIVGRLHVTALFARQYLQTEVILQYDFNEAAGTGLTGLRPSIGSSLWNTSLTNLTTNGVGSLANTGNTATSAVNASLAPSLSAGSYDLVLGGVRFAQLSGTARDYVAFSFRTTITGSEVGTSSRDHMWLRVGNLDGQGDALDAQFGRNSSDTQNSVLNFAPQGTVDLMTSYNTVTGVASFYYDAGNGWVEIGTRSGGDSAAILGNIGYGHAVTVNSGDQIAVDFLRLSRVTGSGAAPASFAGWASLQGIDGEAPAADFDGDGIPNLIEYALDNLDPAVADRITWLRSGNLQSLHKRPQAVANGDVRYAVEWSPDLGVTTAWMPVTPTYEDDTILSFAVGSDTTRFYRVVISLLGAE